MQINIQICTKKTLEFINPEFVISLYPSPTADGITNYLTIHLPSENENYYNRDRIRERVLSYDGLLFIFGDSSNKYIDDLKKLFQKNNKELKFTNFYYSTPEENSEFVELEYSKIFAGGDRKCWDGNHERCMAFFKLLDQDSVLDLYGPENRWKQDFPNSYRGFIFDHKLFTEAVRKSGISLVLHGQQFYEQNLPGARIFEAIAASSLVICDDIKFVKNNFGDNILYVNPYQDEVALYNQVREHLNWIKENPKQAREKAKNAQKIYMDKFVLEKQLKRVEQLHKEIQIEKKIL